MLFLERDRQLAQLDMHRKQAAAGRGACVQLYGEAGAGKTTLLRRFVNTLPSDTLQLWAACEPLLSPQPMGPFADLAEHWPPSLARALREGVHYPALFADLRQTLSRFDAPVVIVIDDLHWADAATLEAVRYLGRRLHDTRLLLMLSFRDDDSIECGPLRRVLGDMPAADTLFIAVPSLSEDAVVELAHSFNRGAQGLHATTGGNPFFVTEILGDASGAAATSVGNAVASRLARLSPAARIAAELVAASPSPLERKLVESLLMDAAEVLDECCNRGVLRVCRDKVAFRHELVRVAVLDGMGPGRVERMHCKLFDAMSRVPGVAVQRLVHHAANAGLDHEVLSLAPCAARAAAALGAHREAAALYRLALERGAALSATDRAALFEAAAVEFEVTGATQESMAARQDALALCRELDDALGVGRNLRCLAQGHWTHFCHRAEAQTAIEGAIATLIAIEPTDAARNELARAHADHARMLSAWLEYPASRAVGERAVAVATALPPTDEAKMTLVLALGAVGGARLYVSNDAAAFTLLDQALALAMTLPYSAANFVAQVYALQQITHLIHRQHEQALTIAQQGMNWCDAHDLDAQRARLVENRALSLLEIGRWREAAEAADECLAMSACNERLRESVLFLQARLRLRLGDDDIVASGYWQALGAAPGSRPLAYRLPAVLSICTEAAWHMGDLDQARACARQGAQAALEGNDARLLGPLLVWLARLGEPLPLHQLAIAPEHALELAGQHAAAVAAWLAHGCPFEAALAGLHGDVATARDALARLLTLGALPAAERARTKLRSMGIKSVPRGPHSRTCQDPEGLTPRQRQIHALLEHGFSNATIAARLSRSERTVESHVAQVLSKLGVQSRTQLARQAPHAGTGATLRTSRRMS